MKAKEFLRDVVDPNVREYLSHPEDRRRAWNAVVSTNSILDFFIVRSAPNRLQVHQVDGLKGSELANEPVLMQLNKIANAFKHVVAQKRNTPLTVYTSIGATFSMARSPTSIDPRLQLYAVEETLPRELYINIASQSVSVEQTVKDALEFWENRFQTTAEI